MSVDGGASGTAGARARYRAFISYSHRDGAFAGRLHRRLEGYVLPRRLGAGRRLAPIFKDREELPAARDLSEQVRAALAVSDCLVIVCSPDAAASPWVGREITLFREMHPDRPILAALIRGEPAEAFPPALAAGDVEPLAADFRKAADGERLALLKLVAGIAGVGVDELVQRDAQRRLRGVMAITTAAVAGMLAMGTMTAFALQARADAERQRAEAEGLVEFMLTDLRDRLKGVGRLDVLTSVNRRALGYYAGQDLKRLPDVSLERRARLLHAMGEDDANRGELDQAERLFDEAYRVTGALMKADPRNPDRVWGHGQSLFWQGYVAYRRGAVAPAKTAWTEYRRLSVQLVELSPRDTRSRRELGYAEQNLCTLAIKSEKAPTDALRACRAAVDVLDPLADAAPDDRALVFDRANSHAWLADAEVLAGDLVAARRSRNHQLALLKPLLDADPRNATLLENWGGAQWGLCRIDFKEGKLSAARAKALAVRDTFAPLSAADPANAVWKAQLDYAKQFLATISQSQKTHGDSHAIAK